jgi:ATP-dependent exoDNAse (exonuclease V) alpha subunit
MSRPRRPKEQAKKAETQLEHIGIPKKIRISKRLELRQGAKVMMLKNMEIIVGDSETVKLVNGSRGVVTKMVSAKQMLPELKERSKKWDEEYKKKRQELERGEVDRQRDGQRVEAPAVEVPKADHAD